MSPGPESTGPESTGPESTGSGGGDARGADVPQEDQGGQARTRTDPVGGQAARMWDAGMGRREGAPVDDQRLAPVQDGSVQDVPGVAGAGEGRPRRRRGGRGRGDPNAVVPDAEFRSYYGQAILKPPVWEQDIAYYLFTGGLAASSSMLAAVADARGETALRRGLRVTSLGALSASTFFLIKDLGRVDRFYNMLRVAKITSPMSVGTWILGAFGPLAGAAAVAEAAPLLPRTGLLGLVRRVAGPAASVAGVGAAATAPLLATYTAVLFADTAVPSWHEPYRELPFVFAGSALAAGGGAGMLVAPPSQAGPARRAAVLGASLELAAAHRVEHGHGLLSEPYGQGRPGRFLRAARALTVTGAAGAALLARRSRVAAAVSGACLLTGSLLTRLAVFEAGVESTKDPKYVVVPQRERVAAGKAVRSDV